MAEADWVGWGGKRGRKGEGTGQIRQGLGGHSGGHGLFSLGRWAPWRAVGRGGQDLTRAPIVGRTDWWGEGSKGGS